MYSTEFDYHPARSLAEAQRLLAAHPGAKLLAGGHSLIPLLKLRLAAPPAVIDIGRVAELHGHHRRAVTRCASAPLTTHAELAGRADVQARGAGACRGRGHRRRSGRPKPRHDRRQRRARRSGVRSADRARRARRAMLAIGPRGRAHDRGGGIFHRHHDDRSGRGRDLVGDRDTRGRPGARLGVRQVRRIRRRATRSSARRPLVQLAGGTCSARARGDRRAGAARAAAAVGRKARSMGKPATPRRCRRGRRRSADDLGDDVTGDIFASADYRARWRRCTSSARSRPPSPPSGCASRSAALTARRSQLSRARSTSCSRRSTAEQYIADRGLAVSIYLALRLKRPLFLEGEAGVGKTEVAKVLARGARDRA